jgi:hypothetical protein
VGRRVRARAHFVGSVGRERGGFNRDHCGTSSDARRGRVEALRARLSFLCGGSIFKPVTIALQLSVLAQRRDQCPFEMGPLGCSELRRFVLADAGVYQRDVQVRWYGHGC